jgi:hypothetical protein
MNAKELIEFLSEYEPNTDVVIYIMENDKLSGHVHFGTGDAAIEGEQQKVIALIVDKNTSNPIEIFEN